VDLNADPDPEFYLMCIRMRIRIFSLMLMWIQVTKMMQIHADPDPQHCCKPEKNNKVANFDGMASWQLTIGRPL
jgi:hypothetical protein